MPGGSWDAGNTPASQLSRLPTGSAGLRRAFEAGGASRVDRPTRFVHGGRAHSAAASARVPGRDRTVSGRGEKYPRSAPGALELHVDDRPGTLSIAPV